VLSGRGLCDKLITRPEEPYRLWCVGVCDLESSVMRRSWPTGGCHAKNKQKILLPLLLPLLQCCYYYLLTYSMEQSPSWEANWFCS